TRADLSRPANPGFDAQGNLYFADSHNYRIRRVDTHGVITTVAGDGIPYAAGMDREGPALERSLDLIAAMTVDPGGNLYFQDYSIRQTRRVTASGSLQASPTLTTTGQVAADGAGNVYATDGIGSRQIRRFTSDGTGSDFAGYGPPANVSADDDGQPAAGISM